MGPPGTGKTLLACAVAGEAGVPSSVYQQVNLWNYLLEEEQLELEIFSMWHGNLPHQLYLVMNLMQLEGSVVEVSMMNETKH